MITPYYIQQYHVIPEYFILWNCCFDRPNLSYLKLLGTVDHTRKERDEGRFLDSIEPIQEQSSLSFRIDLSVIVYCKIGIKIQRITRVEYPDRNISDSPVVTVKERMFCHIGEHDRILSYLVADIVDRVDQGYIKGGSSSHA